MLKWYIITYFLCKGFFSSLRQVFHFNLQAFIKICSEKDPSIFNNDRRDSYFKQLSFKSRVGLLQTGITKHSNSDGKLIFFKCYFFVPAHSSIKILDVIWTMLAEVLSDTIKTQKKVRLYTILTSIKYKSIIIYY